MNTNDFRLPKTILDMHCHGRGWGHRQKTTVEQVLKEALNGLISIVAFMPNTEPRITTMGALTAYLGVIERATKSLSIKHRQYVYFGVTNDNIESCALALKLPEVIGLKIYSEWGIKKEVIIKAMKLARAANKVVAIHCDDPDIIAEKGNTVVAEFVYVQKMIYCGGKVPGVKIVICHVSCIQSARKILYAQKKGMKIAIELCIQYLFFDKDKYNWRDDLHENFYMCLNRLRERRDRLYFINALLKSNNPLVIISSDNACHTEQEKIAGANGIPSNQELVPGIVTLAIQNGISEERVAELISFNASEHFGVPVSRELVDYSWRQVLNNNVYNNGIVINPWAGLLMYFPVK